MKVPEGMGMGMEHHGEICSVKTGCKEPSHICFKLYTDEGIKYTSTCMNHIGEAITMLNAVQDSYLRHCAGMDKEG
jgi:hypothetical protein